MCQRLWIWSEGSRHLGVTLMRPYSIRWGVQMRRLCVFVCLFVCTAQRISSLSEKRTGHITIKCNLLKLIPDKIATSRFISVRQALLSPLCCCILMGCDSTCPEEWGNKRSPCQSAVISHRKNLPVKQLRWHWKTWRWNYNSVLSSSLLWLLTTSDFI